MIIGISIMNWEVNSTYLSAPFIPVPAGEQFRGALTLLAESLHSAPETSGPAKHIPTTALN